MLILIFFIHNSFQGLTGNREKQYAKMEQGDLTWPPQIIEVKGFFLYLSCFVNKPVIFIIWHFQVAVC